MELVSYPLPSSVLCQDRTCNTPETEPLCFQRAADSALQGWQASLSLLCVSGSLIEVLH